MASLRELGEKWLRIPPEPAAPPGDEASARVFNAAPNFLHYRRIHWAIRTLLSGVFFLIGTVTFTSFLTRMFGGHDQAPTLVAVVWVLAVAGFLGNAIFTFALVGLDFEKRWYLVTDRSLRIREGILTMREITFTFANIQNLSVVQGPIQRALGISDLKVETAGGGSGGNQKQAVENLHVGHFRGINNAEEVKQVIAARMRAHRDSGLGDPDEPQREISDQPRLALTDALEAVLAEAKALRASAATSFPA